MKTITFDGRETDDPRDILEDLIDDLRWLLDHGAEQYIDDLHTRVERDAGEARAAHYATPAVIGLTTFCLGNVGL